ncbi:mucin-5AC isoform X2 [Lutzomyia longipalpis]|uniref:mucin-5AC isoform X2 n=1 Tax=Lutzomyia longipalpis TaxID=7200 RepID=UPI002483C1A0|nr:mucin-5AC isoform X2 [Lutzomyia longipalpis]
MSKKNPLLSSAGLTFDDFTHNARLMPAAAPVPVATVVPDVQGSRGHSEEPKEEIRPAVFGSPPPPVAAEASFSDISLEEPSAEQQGTFLGASEPQLYNPLQGIDPYDTAGSKVTSGQGGESIFNPLAQAAQLKESLQHIPSVASTVFSTFSSILKGTAGEYSQQQQQSEGPPVQESIQQDFSQSAYKSPLDAIYEQQVLSQTSQNPVEQPQASPLLFSPEDPTIPAFSTAHAPPPSSGSSNTFRLGGSKKKTYAPVPGLSSGAGNFVPQETPSFPQQNLPPLPIPGQNIEQQKSSVTPPPVNFYSTSQPVVQPGGFPEQVNSSIPTQPTQGSQNKFSLSSFFSAPILDRFQGKSNTQNEQVAAEISSVDAVGSFQQQTSFTQPQASAPINQINPQLFKTNPIAASTAQNQPPSSGNLHFGASGFPPAASQAFPDPLQHSYQAPVFAGTESKGSVGPPPTNQFFVPEVSKGTSQQESFGAPPVNQTPSPQPFAASSTQTITPQPFIPPPVTQNPQPFVPTQVSQSPSPQLFVPESVNPPNPSPQLFTPTPPANSQEFLPQSTTQNSGVFNPPPPPSTASNFPPQSAPVFVPQSSPLLPPEAPRKTETSSAPPPTNTANPYSGYRLAKRTPTYKNSLIPETKSTFFVPQQQQQQPNQAQPVPVNFFTPAPQDIPSAPQNLPLAPQQSPQAELKIETKVSSPTIFKSTSEPVAAVRPDQAFFLPKSPQEEKTPYTPETSHIDQLCTDLAATKLPQVVQQTQNFFGTNQTTTNWFDSNQNAQLITDHATTDEDTNKNTTDIHASFFDCPPDLKPDQAPPNFFSFPKVNGDDVSINNNSLIVEKSSVDDSKVSLASFASNEKEQQATIEGTVLANGESTREAATEEAVVSADQQFNANLLENSAITADMASSRLTPTTSPGPQSVTDAPAPSGTYRPVYKHWFFRQKVEGKDVWTPFSMTDSLALEDGFMNPAAAEGATIATDGGRHDVNITNRTRTSIYWTAEVNEVRRCSWFYKAVDSRFVPYEEETADFLEEEYKKAFTSGQWHKQLTLPDGDAVNFHGPNVMVHFLQAQTPDAWGNTPQVTNRPRVIKRGVDEFNIEDGEPEQIDHILFVVHGIGKACDFKFRTVEEVVDEFRSIALQMVQSHYRTSYDAGEIGRIEVLPISWHSELHSEESGIDAKLKSITLESIPKLRNFTNETLLDVLFYTSPIFCQSIMDTVCGSINRVYKLFCQRNPNFRGGVSLAGHSLGSLILFDLLCHQKAPSEGESEVENSENPDQGNVMTPTEPILRPEKQTEQQINYTMGPAGTGQPFINYPQLDIRPKSFFAFGSPIGMFVTVRGFDTLGLDFKLPTCDNFYNIFHPYDVVAYRIEGLVNPELSSLRPVLIPHHKGRKRMHLELRETMARVGGEIKQRIFDTFRQTVDTVTQITSLGRTDPLAIKSEVDKVLEEQLHLDETAHQEVNSASSSGGSDCDAGETDLPLGRLNQSRRIDYVLQEAPLEFFNEYIFALTSHVCYWQSEDTILFVVKEIYSSMGVQTDNKIPQQSLTIERPTGNIPTR